MSYMLVLMSLLLLGSCSIKTGTEFDPKTADDIIIGRTTKQEVQQLLGTPNDVSMIRDGESWSYSFGRTDIRGSNFIPYANLFHNQTDMSNTVLQISFNRAGKVIDCAMTSKAYVARGGFSHMNDSRLTSTGSGKRCGESSVDQQDRQIPTQATKQSVKRKS